MKTLKTKITLVLLSIMVSLSANAFKVSGTVTQKDNGMPLPFVAVTLKNAKAGVVTDYEGKYHIEVPALFETLVFRAVGFEVKEIPINGQTTVNVALEPSSNIMSEVEIVEDELVGVAYDMEMMPMESTHKKMMVGGSYTIQESNIIHNTEEYDVLNENTFQNPKDAPLSTFSIDVDAASYSNVRRMINNGRLPQKDMVRIEEMVNYFHYDYPNPTGQHPFSIVTEVSEAPWNTKHRLVHIGIQGKMIDYDNLQPSNLVFLIDVSGSMSDRNKLPLLKSSMKLLVNELRETDRVAIVVYAGAAGLVLPSTPVSEKAAIIAALNNLSAGGSTAGGAGIKLAYKVAEEHLIEGGNNRVILATDGDFNVGESSTASMVELIENNRDKGIFLTITGFGMGNYKDGRMEQISNAGNGNYFYIDNIREAEKVFVTEMRATLFTIAKDVKIQVEFNPAQVQAYRLIGYENRMLEAKDFNDDKKDAGELGAGHTVTALYEIIPVGINSTFSNDIDPLKYQKTERAIVAGNGELLTVKFRYKKPDGDKSIKIVQVLKDTDTPLSETSDNFRFSAAVAEFGMLLRNSKFKAEAGYGEVIKLANGARGKDEEGYRTEFINLVKSSRLMVNNDRQN